MDAPTTRKEKTAKTLYGNIMMEKLKIPVEDYNKMKVIEVSKSVKGDLNIRFESSDTSGFVFHMTKNLLKADKISIREYVSAQLYSRHRELSSIAKLYRDEGLLTHIRIGREDYKFYTKEKGDTTPWTALIPYIIPENVKKK